MVQRQVQLRLNPCCNGKGSKDRKKHKVLTLRLYAPQRDLASTGFNINYVPWKRVQSYEFIAICQRTNRLNIPKKASTAGKDAKTTWGSCRTVVWQLFYCCVTVVLLLCDSCHTTWMPHASCSRSGLAQSKTLFLGRPKVTDFSSYNLPF